MEKFNPEKDGTMQTIFQKDKNQIRIKKKGELEKNDKTKTRKEQNRKTR